ncbi:MAG TPA: hypothetical protein VGM30_21610 [Puia sp.]|jgi:uncharacterized membrane protein
MIKRTLSLIGYSSLCLFPLLTMAQTSENVRKYTAFDMRSNGKIYVLAACMLVIMIGLILYMVRLDRKVTRLEKEDHR